MYTFETQLYHDIGRADTNGNNNTTNNNNNNNNNVTTNNNSSQSALDGDTVSSNDANTANRSNDVSQTIRSGEAFIRI